MSPLSRATTSTDSFHEHTLHNQMGNEAIDDSRPQVMAFAKEWGVAIPSITYGSATTSKERGRAEILREFRVVAILNESDEVDRISRHVLQRARTAGYTVVACALAMFRKEFLAEMMQNIHTTAPDICDAVLVHAPNLRNLSVLLFDWCSWISYHLRVALYILPATI